MHYEGNIIRPPSEADSILLQVTVACSHNSCAFCGAYLGERFRIKDEAMVFADIDFAARHMTRMRRVFLCDGDAMILPQKRLTRILGRIRERLPWVTRVGVYANVKSLRGKSAEELRELKSLGLAMVYMGLESGDDDLLRSMGKEADTAEMIEEAGKVQKAGMKLSASVIVGLGGTEGWQRHARLTAQALTNMAPDQAAALCLIPVPGTQLWERMQAGQFTLPDGPAMVRELRMLLEHTHMNRGLFLADHASNHVPLKLRLPRDKEYGLSLLDAAIKGELPLTPDSSRRL